MADESRSDGVWNIKIKRGGTFGRTLTLTDSDGVAVNLNSYSLRMHIRKSRVDAAVFLDVTVDATDKATGIFVVSLTATQTKTLTKPKYLFDAELVNGSEITPYVYGEIEVYENAVKV